MLAVRKIKLDFGGRILFNEISFNINLRDRIGLIGKNGAGKSTLLKVFAGQRSLDSGDISFPKEYKIGYLPQDGGTNTNNSVYQETKLAFKEIDILNTRLDEINQELQVREDYVSDSYNKLLEELHEVNERLTILGVDSIDAQIEQTLFGLGFSREDLMRPVKSLSGGWQMRIELAKILLQRPNLILLDEPTNHLDIESIVWLEEFLANYEFAVLIVSHDRRFLDNCTNRTIELLSSRIFDLNFAYTKFMEQREEVREIQLRAKVNQDKQIKQMEDFAARYRAKARQASRVQSKLKQIDKIDKIEIDDMNEDSIRFRFPDPPRSARVVAEVIGLTKYYGDKLILDNIDFVLEREEKVAFVGRNGEGKSTLTKILCNLTDFQGTARVGQSVNLGYYAQHQAELLDPNRTVFEVIDHAAKGDIRTQIRNFLGAFLFTGDDVYKKVSVLSGGEKSRLALCKLLLEPYNFLILDEPTNHLDMNSKDILKEALISFKGSMIIVSHDRQFLEGLTSKTIEFKDRKIKEYLGDINDFMHSKKIEHISQIEKREEERIESKKEFDQPKKNFSKNKEELRRLQKLEKDILVLEDDIRSLEEKIAAINKEFENPYLFEDIEKSKNLQLEFEKLKSNLQLKVSHWEKVLLEYEEVQNI